MPWVRLDDGILGSRKLRGASDSEWILYVSGIVWCARNLTDGIIRVDDLRHVSERVRYYRRAAAGLVARELWHTAEHVCPSRDCPPPGPDGWTVHDYLFYQPSKERVEADRRARAERQTKWRRNASRNASTTSTDVGRVDALVTLPRPVPDPLRVGVGDLTCSKHSPVRARNCAACASERKGIA